MVENLILTYQRFYENKRRVTMKKQKIIAMILVFLTVVTVAGIVNANVPTVIGAKKTEAVELMNTTSSQPEDFLGNIIPTNKLKQYQMLEGEEDKLFVASPKCDLESIIKEFKNGTGEIDSSSKYYAQLEKIANGSLRSLRLSSVS